MTEISKVTKYEMLLNNEYQGKELKSFFLTQIEDNLNNEISLKTVKTKTDINNLIQSSLEYV